MEKLADFKAPPIVEVVAGVVFDPLQAFDVQHFGLFWQGISEEFPNARRAPPNISENVNFTLPNVPVRCWFTSLGGGRLIQLQQDSFFFNWRREDNEGPEDYPEFSEIFPSFRRHLQKLESFLSDRNLGSIQARGWELTYVNIIPRSDISEHVSVLGDVVVDNVRRGGARFLPNPAKFEWVSVYGLPEDLGTLTVRATSATQTHGDKEQVVRMELCARSAPVKQGLEEMEPWFSIAHEHIVKGFCDLTDREVQQHVWGRK